MLGDVFTSDAFVLYTVDAFDYTPSRSHEVVSKSMVLANLHTTPRGRDPVVTRLKPMYYFQPFSFYFYIISFFLC